MWSPGKSWGTIPFGFPALGRHAEKNLIERAAIEPSISILPDENWVTFTFRYVVDLKKRRSTKDRLFTDILDRIARTEGRVSVGASTLEVSLKQTP